MAVRLALPTVLGGSCKDRGQHWGHVYHWGRGWEIWRAQDLQGPAGKGLQAKLCMSLGARTETPSPGLCDPLSGSLHTQRETVISLKSQGAVGAPLSLTQA